jgi:GntR family transcriptional regulator
MANPMYRQIAEDLREQIDSGTLKPGQQLRTEGELRDHYCASRNTVRDAIKWLANLGLVETRPGQGTFVVSRIDPYVATLTGDPRGPGGDITVTAQYGEAAEDRPGGIERRITSTTIPVVEIQQAPADVAGPLRIAEGSQVISRHQRRYVEDTPWSLQTTFYPMGFVLQGASRLIEAVDIKPGTVSYLAETLGLRQLAYRDWITVRAPDATEAQFFNLPQDGRIGVFEIFRTAFDQTGTPMRLTVSVYPTDRNQFVINVGEMPDTGLPAELGLVKAGSTDLERQPVPRVLASPCTVTKADGRPTATGGRVEPAALYLLAGKEFRLSASRPTILRQPAADARQRETPH